MKYGKMVGKGNTAIVYDLEEGKVLKLFLEGYPKEAVEREFQNAKAISDKNFAKSKAYEIIFHGEQMGIVYEIVKGESLLDWVSNTGDVHRCAVYMAELHKSILRNEITDVPNYKNFLEQNIIKGLSDNLDKQKKALQTLDRLGNGNTLCHGDFHPGNIFLSGGNTVAIDFMNVCQGEYLYDVARTVFLIEYTPIPVETKDKEMVYRLKKTLADLYLTEMNITRDKIKDFLFVIGASRLGECPNEQIAKGLDL